MSFVSVLTVIGESVARNGGVVRPGYSSIRVLMVLPIWTLRGWAGVGLSVLVGGVGSLVVFLVVGLRYPTGTGAGSHRSSNTPRIWNGRTKK